jgi:hypothetical protein
MRENVVREVVSRMLTDPEFLHVVQQTPGKALRGYDLTQEELSAISASDSGALGIGRLESRISAATTRPIMADPPDDCGCCTVSPKKCPPCP